MITKEELDQVIEDLDKVETMEYFLLVLAPIPSETTDSGIIKGDAVMEDEKDKLESFMYVVKAGLKDGPIQPRDKVFTQGEVLTFTEKSNVKELDIAPEGYGIGLIAVPSVKLYIKA